MPSPLQVIIIVAIIAAVFAVIFTIYFWERKKRLKTLIADLNAHGGDNVWSFSAKGRKVRLYYYTGSRSSPQFVSLSVPVSFQGQCLIRKEGIPDKASKAIQLNKEFSIGDPEIDEKIYFECEDEFFLRRFSQTPEFKIIITAALRDFSYLKIEDRVCWLKKNGDVASFKPDQIIKAAESLVAFTQLIHADSEETLTPETERFEKKFQNWGLFWIGFMILGVIYIISLDLYPLVYPFHFYMDCLKLSAVIFAVVILIWLMQFSGHSTSAKKFFVVLFLGGLSVFASCCEIVSVLNTVLDESRSVSFETKLDHKSTYSGRYGTKYNLVLNPVKPNQENNSFLVSKEYYEGVSVGARCAEEIKSGFFHYAWVVGVGCEKGVIAKGVNVERPSKIMKIDMQKYENWENLK